MSEEEVIEARRLRKAARKVFDTQKAMIQSDLGSAGVGKRVAGKLAQDGRIIAEEAAELAKNNRPVVAAGAVALTAWLLRKPLMALADRVFGGEEQEDVEDPDQPSAETHG